MLTPLTIEYPFNADQACDVRKNAAWTEEALLILPVDTRTWFVKIGHRVEMIFKTIGMMFVRMHDSFQGRRNGTRFLEAVEDESGELNYPSNALPWNNDARTQQSQGFNLCIHGLKGSPLHWTRFLRQMEEEHPEMDTLTPHVALQGNCSIEEAASPLLRLVEDYLKKNPGQPVNIIGTSNGGRIAAYLETHLDPTLLGESTLTITSIAGVHYGTTVIDRVKQMGLLRFAKFDPQLAADFEWGSETAHDLHMEWRKKQAIWEQQGCNVKHLFCASTEDEQVQNNGTSLPLPGEGLESKHVAYAWQVYHGESHTSVVERAQRDVLSWIFNNATDSD